MESILPGIQDQRCKSPYDATSRYDQHKTKPKPQNHIDFLMNDVKCHHTKRIMSLNGARLTIFIEVTLGDFWENRIESVHWSGEIVFHKLKTKCIKLSTQEDISHVNLHQKISHIQYFTEHQTSDKSFIDSNVFVEIIFDQRNSAFDMIMAWQYIISAESHLGFFLIVF